MAKTTRIQFDLPEEQAEGLEILKDLGGVKTTKDLFNNALTLLEWAINEKKAGRIIVAIDEKNEVFRELVMPILDKAAKLSNSSSR